MKTENEIKTILIDEDLKDSLVGMFFKSLGFELTSSFEEDIKYYLIINDYLSEMSLDIPRIKFEDDCGFENNQIYQLQVDLKVLANKKNSAYLAKYFESDMSFDFINLTLTTPPIMSNVKISDYLNIGYFIDAVVIEAYRKKHDVVKVRSFLNHFFDIAFQHMYEIVENNPIDLSYSAQEDFLTLDFSFDCSRFDDFKSFLFDKEMLYLTNIFDVEFIESRNVVKMKATFFNQLEMKNNRVFSSFIYSKLTKRKIENSDVTHESALVEHEFETFDLFEDPNYLDKIFLNQKDLDEVLRFMNDSENDDLTIIASLKKEMEERIFNLKNNGEDLKLLDLKEIITMLSPEKPVNDDPDSLFSRLCIALKNSRAKAATGQNNSSEDHSETQRLKISLQKSISIIKNKDLLVKKMKKDFDNHLFHSNEQIETLEKKVKELKISNFEQKQIVSAQTQKLQEEKVELKEIENTKEIDFETPAEVVNETFKVNADLMATIKAQTEQILALQDELKQVDDKYKEANLEAKRLDQRLKYSNSQMEVLLKKKNIVPKGIGKDSSEVTRELDKMKATFKRLEQDYAEKKTESFRLKQENLILTTKLAEVEKKLSYAEKKVA